MDLVLATFPKYTEAFGPTQWQCNLESTNDRVNDISRMLLIWDCDYALTLRCRQLLVRTSRNSMAAEHTGLSDCRSSGSLPV